MWLRVGRACPVLRAGTVPVRSAYPKGSAAGLGSIFPDASSKERASRIEGLLTPKRVDSSRWDGSRPSSLDAIISSSCIATFFETELQFSISLTSGQTGHYYCQARFSLHVRIVDTFHRGCHYQAVPHLARPYDRAIPDSRHRRQASTEISRCSGAGRNPRNQQ